jgi:putative pyruvate formate lyase activating enzyme
MAYNLRLKGCHNINWVGGEPVIHLHNIVEAVHIMSRFTASMARHSMHDNSDSASYNHAYYKGEFNVPQLWNSNFFMSKEAMNILRCIIDVWLPDLKFGSDRCALRLARTPWYWDTVTSNIKQIYEWGEDMVIRHLIMPGHIECCTKPVLRWIAENTPDALVNIMDQYRPENYCDMYSPKYDPAYRDMARFPTGEEIDEAYRYADSLGLNFEIVTFEKRATGIL